MCKVDINRLWIHDVPICRPGRLRVFWQPEHGSGVRGQGSGQGSFSPGGQVHAIHIGTVCECLCFRWDVCLKHGKRHGIVGETGVVISRVVVIIIRWTLSWVAIATVYECILYCLAELSSGGMCGGSYDVTRATQTVGHDHASGYRNTDVWMVGLFHIVNHWYV